MSKVNESRPIGGVQIELGGSYAQPSGSEHACWLGQSANQLGWSGDRNAGQPLYAAQDPQANQNELDARMRSMAGDVLESWKRQHESTLRGLGGREEDLDKLLMQLYSLSLD